MGICYDEQQRVFQLNTKNSSYLIGIVDEENFVGHIYFGAKVPDTNLVKQMRIEEPPFVPSKNNRERVSFLDCFPMEYPAHGLGDFREDCFSIRTEKGHTACSLSYRSHKISSGKPKLSGLPATFGTDEVCTTLELYCVDEAAGLKVTLIYSTFEDVDVIARSVLIENTGDKPVFLTKVLSACLDMNNQEFDYITLHGSWGRERRIQRMPVGYGMQGVSSIRGESSHQEHPFLALAERSATQDSGEVYGMHFVYSGNFIAQVQLTQFNTVRATMGIHPVDFSWKLEPGESFTAPEVVLVYSNTGIGGMTRNLHDLYRNHLIRSKFKDCKRPILINNWEATYFDFTTDKLLAIAKEAAACGIEMLVMDDGWFGTRNSDNCALGDWIVNEKKLPGGLPFLVEKVNELGMKFGIWFEPEMISPDSELYRTHPDWAIQIPERTASLCREQYVLDLSRPEVRDYVYGCVSGILKSANIAYVKWDMNRQLTDIGSYALPADRQGELFHRYVLGVYELQERLITEFPDLLLENCSGGGARFDPGMLYYSPQIWCSDDTDAVERLSIQEGTAMIYPLSTMGAHVSDCPNHAVGRVTPFDTRGYVALAGTFGYELDITKIPAQDREKIPSQVALYHKYNDLIRSGDYYRIASYAANHEYDCYEVVSKDKSEALVTYIQVLGRVNFKSRNLRLKGLDASKRYCLEETGEIYYGSTWMNVGILIDPLWGDFQGRLLHFVEAAENEQA